MWFLFGEVSSSSGCWDGLRYFIVALPEPSINNFETTALLKLQIYSFFPLASFARS